MLPCKSIASILPSGETETCMEVPSWTMMVWCCGEAGWAAAVPAMAQRPTTVDTKRLRRMYSPILFVIAGEPIHGKIEDLDKRFPIFGDHPAGVIWLLRSMSAEAAAGPSAMIAAPRPAANTDPISTAILAIAA